MKKYIHILFSLLFILPFAEGQVLVSAELVETLTPDEVTALFGIAGPYKIESYKVLYTTKDINGNDHTASGLYTIPIDDATSFPMLAVQHGTTSSREVVPSRLEGGYELGVLIASFGFHTVQADMLGLGDSPGVHPYIHNDSEAWVARDLLRAAREYADQDWSKAYTEQVFITGYSQGGHAGMALHKMLELEHNDEFTVTAASHMSGPYSISEKMIDFTLGDEEYLFSAYLAWVALSMKTAYPVELADYEMSDFFRSQYVDDILAFANEDIDLNLLNTRLQNGLRADVGRVTPKDLLNPDILTAIKTDPTHPLSVALAKQDNYDWTPNAPTRLMYCTADDQVTYENAILAEEVMNMNGAGDVVAVQCGENLNHGGCVTPATTNTVFFFLGFATFPTTIEDKFILDHDAFFAHQSGDVLNVMIDESVLSGGQVSLEVSNMLGKSLYNSSTNNVLNKINVRDMNSGVYVLRLSENNRLIKSQKVFIR